MKDLLKNITTLYKFANHSYEVGEDNSLLVPASAELDCGIYRCTLWPPLGHYIQEANTKYDSAGENLQNLPSQVSDLHYKVAEDSTCSFKRSRKEKYHKK